MQILLTAEQMRAADADAIANQKTSSVDLMENAAKAFVKVFKKAIPDQKTRIAILCGQGNNGGDGLAIARLLFLKKYENVCVYLVNFSKKESKDYLANLKRVSKIDVPVIRIQKATELTDVNSDLIIDAVLGSGLSRPLDGEYQNLAIAINRLNRKVVAVDVPTGFFSEGAISENHICIKAELVISFQRPKINFFFPESAKAIQRFKVVDIGLSEEFIQNQQSNWKLTDRKSIGEIIQIRKKFSHKGTYGHALLIAGSANTMGAALLTAGASLHAGAGLTTLCLPEAGLTALNATLPEVMALPRNANLSTTAFEKYSAIAIGPGLGLEAENERIFETVVSLKKRLVVDADGLTILSTRRDLLALLPEGSILTPHMKEFDRIFGVHQTWFERVEMARKEATERKIIIVLKNQFTFICLPNGDVVVNPTGNPAMASGGMGDVLTGIIVALLAQSYSPSDAAILAVYVHGKSGDQLAKKYAVVTASQIVKQISRQLAGLVTRSK